jgi:hypothetical protein
MVRRPPPAWVISDLSDISDYADFVKTASGMADISPHQRKKPESLLDSQASGF